MENFIPTREQRRALSSLSQSAWILQKM